MIDYCFVALAQSELEWPKYLSYSLLFGIDSSKGFESSPRRSKK